MHIKKNLIFFLSFVLIFEQSLDISLMMKHIKAIKAYKVASLLKHFHSIYLSCTNDSVT